MNEEKAPPPPDSGGSQGDLDPLASLARFSTDRAVDGVFWVEPSGRILYVNDAATRILGYSREELVGKTVPEIDPNFPEAAWPAHWEDLRRRRAFTFESDHYTKSGRVIRTEVSVNLIEYEGREYNCAIVRDVTARKQDERQLRRQLEQLRALNTLVEALAASTNLEQVYEAALDGLTGALGVTRLAILVSDERGPGRFVASRGISERYRHAVEGHMFWAPDANDPQPVVVADVTTALAMAPFLTVLRDERIRALMAVPLSVKQRVIGKCMLYYDAPYQATPDDLRLVQTIAGHVAIGLERQRVQAELWRSSHMLRTFADGTSDACYVKDTSGRYLWCNRAAAQFVNLTPRDVVGRRDADLFPAREAAQLNTYDRDVVQSRQVLTYTATLPTPTGTHVFHIRKGPLVDEQGTLVGLFGVARDVTQEQEAEEALRKHEARFKALVQNSSDIITVLDATGTVSYVSPAGNRIFGWTDADVLHHPVIEFIHPDDRDRAMTALARLLQEPGHTESVDLRFRRADGDYLMLEINGTNSLADPNIQGVVVNARDVTERNRMGEQLRQVQKMEALGRLAGGIAHDFNNLLTVIGTNSGELLREYPLDPEVRTMVQEIRTAGDRAAQLTRRLLAFGRKQAFAPRVIDLNQVLSDLSGMLRRVIGEHITLQVGCGAVPAAVRVDQGELEQVVMNLAINARDAMPDGGRLTIETRRLEHPPRVALIVRDTGVGMDAETKARMFEPFFTTKGPGQGTGLGLATVYGIVSHSNATIDVETAPCSGTTLVIAFPAAETDADAPGEADGCAQARGTETILIVEDEEMVRQLTRRVLTKRGYRVLEASSAEDALARYGDNTDTQLLLTDVVMPGMNGRALAAQLTARHPQLKVLYMTGYAAADGGPAGWQPSAGDVLLQKPFEPDVLERLVRQTLDHGQAQSVARLN